jgi:Ni2+-binding GTPase involved in maturation of urease and hydrogenase
MAVGIVHFFEVIQIASRNLQAVRPNLDFFKLSAKTGEGVAGYLE